MPILVRIYLLPVLYEVAEHDRSLRDGKRELDQAQSRIRKLDEIIQRLYEDNIEGKFSDERFAKISANSLRTVAALRKCAGGTFLAESFDAMLRNNPRNWGCQKSSRGLPIS